MRHQHHHGQMQHLRVELEKAGGLGKEPVLEPTLAMHLHLQQHHGPLSSAHFGRTWPERPIEAMVRRFELGGFKAVQRITGSIGTERGRCKGPLRQ